MWRRKNKFPFRNDKKDFSQIGARKKKYWITQGMNEEIIHQNNTSFHHLHFLPFLLLFLKKKNSCRNNKKKTKCTTYYYSIIEIHYYQLLSLLSIILSQEEKEDFCSNHYFSIITNDAQFNCQKKNSSHSQKIILMLIHWMQVCFNVFWLKHTIFENEKFPLP